MKLQTQDGGRKPNAGPSARKQASNLTAARASRLSVTTSADGRAHACSAFAQRASAGSALRMQSQGAGQDPLIPPAPPRETEVKRTEQGPQALPGIRSIQEVGINN